MSSDPTSLFTARADAYQRSRPGYPAEVIDLLAREAGWTPRSIIADIGAGTGLSAEPFLARGSTVFAVEPNESMRRAATERLGGQPLFHAVSGTAERTTLPDASVDFVVSATAFHWFDVAASRAEFRRILRPGGHVVLMWNVRRSENPPLMAEYEAVLRRVERDHASRADREKRTPERVATFFAPMPFEWRVFENPQVLDLEGLKGRFMSSSFTPLPGDPGFESAMRDLERLFERFASSGLVTFTYDTFVYWGRVD